MVAGLSNMPPNEWEFIRHAGPSALRETTITRAL